MPFPSWSYPDLFISEIWRPLPESLHYSDVIMSEIASQITCVSIVCSTVCSGADQRKHQSSASLAFLRGIHQWLLDFPHKGPVTRKMFPFDDIIIALYPTGGLNKMAHTLSRFSNAISRTKRCALVLADIVETTILVPSQFQVTATHPLKQNVVILIKQNFRPCLYRNLFFTTGQWQKLCCRFRRLCTRISNTDTRCSKLHWLVLIMKTSSKGNIFRVTGHLCGEFTGHRWTPRPKASDLVTQSFDVDVFFDLSQNKRLCKHWWGWWFETPSRPLWCHYNVYIYIYIYI